MANVVTNTAQLSTFEMIRDILIDDTTLSAKFRKQDYHEIRPNALSTGTRFPYIHIGFPAQNGLSEETIKQSTTIKDNNVEINVVLDFTAHPKIKSYCERILNLIESAESTFESNGYYRPVIDLLSITPEYESGKQIVVATFNLSFEGVVRR